MSALHITVSDLTAALAPACGPARKRVVDEDAGETVGWIVDHGTYVEWGSGDFGGTVLSREQALGCIEEITLNRRRWAADDAAYEAEIAALPEPLRTLRIERDRAAVDLEIERHRNIVRPDDLALAHDRLRDAERAYAAAEREAMEAA